MPISGRKFRKTGARTISPIHLFSGFCLQNQGQIEFSTSAFLSLKVEGIARGLSWIAWLYLSPRRICAHIGPHPPPSAYYLNIRLHTGNMTENIQTKHEIERIDRTAEKHGKSNARKGRKFIKEESNL